MSSMSSQAGDRTREIHRCGAICFLAILAGRVLLNIFFIYFYKKCPPRGLIGTMQAKSFQSPKQRQGKKVHGTTHPFSHQILISLFLFSSTCIMYIYLLLSLFSFPLYISFCFTVYICLFSSTCIMYIYISSFIYFTLPLYFLLLYSSFSLIVFFLSLPLSLFPSFILSE